MGFSLYRWANAAARGSALVVVLAGIAATTPAAAQSAPTHVPEAPVGHRQPSTTNVPENVLRDEGAMAPPGETGLDKKLNICRGC